ncbi:hypothetical protein ACFBBE_004405 [Escherichia coli]|nr:hypothetical protein [Escherichia coli]EFJ8659360.1 hypothetical protein [Escherichia coli]EFJ8668560.1 hypothetical protein [Escherichia coli]
MLTFDNKISEAGRLYNLIFSQKLSAVLSLLMWFGISWGGGSSFAHANIVSGNWGGVGHIILTPCHPTLIMKPSFAFDGTYIPNKSTDIGLKLGYNQPEDRLSGCTDLPPGIVGWLSDDKNVLVYIAEGAFEYIKLDDHVYVNMSINARGQTQIYDPDERVLGVSSPFGVRFKPGKGNEQIIGKLDSAVYMVWNGKGDPWKDFFLSEGFFILNRDGYSSGYKSPVISIKKQGLEPKCSADISNGGQVSLLMTRVPEYCQSGCRRLATGAGLAQTSVSVFCSIESESPDSITPYITFNGLTDVESGSFLLKTSQSGVFIWGADSLISPSRGCHWWGKKTPYSSEFVPFDGITPWKLGKFPGGSIWSRSIYWGLCFDSEDGRKISVAPYTASATWTLHVD